MKNTHFQSRTIGSTDFLHKKRSRHKKAITARLKHVFALFTTWIRRPKPPKNLRKRIMYLVIGLCIVGLITLAALWFTLPDINDPATMFPAQSTVILDRNGIELYRLFSEEDRTYVSGDGIQQSIKDATIAIEDERFISRSACFDITGYLRAALSQIAPRYFVRSGGSTLTQQFAGNALVGRERSLLRKVRELLLACQLEQRYNKDELLELYLNWIPYGQNAYGIEQASKKYFGISAKDLSLAQSAVLASLPQRPSYFNPYGSHEHTTVSDAVQQQIANGTITSVSAIPNSAISIGLIGQKIGSGSTTLYIGGRTDQVLKNMLDQQRITLDAYNKALSELQKIVFAPDRKNIRAPHFVLGIQKDVEDILGIEDTIMQQGGFRITTTLDWNLQNIAEKVVAKHRDDVKNRFGAYNIALVALSPKTREVLAYVGNSNFDDDEHEGKIDMALSPRQPGSSFKPFAYLAAFEQGYGPGSVIYDVPTKFGSDEPSNYDGTFWGLTTMRSALAGSRNIPAIKTFFLAGGEDALLSLARRLGVTTPTTQKALYRTTTPDFDYGWPLSIGAAETPLIEMVQGYAGIADGGIYLPVKKILKITDKDGNIRYFPKDEPPQQVIDERLTAEVTSILSDVNARPQNQYWRDILSVPGFSAAAKTGTSNKCLERDAKGGCTLRRPESTWTVGYTPNIIAGVWAGNATSQSLYDKADGLTTAAPIWHDFMTEANRTIDGSQTAFALPSRMSSPLLSRLSGKLASSCTPVSLQFTDIFLDENVPSEEDPACVMLKVDKVTGLLSSPACPSDAVEEQPFFLVKSELPIRWPQWEEGVQAWAAKQMDIWRATDNHSGSLLPLPLAPTTQCDPSLTPGRGVMPELSITSPSSGEIVDYPVFRARLDIRSGSPVQEVRFDIDGKTMSTYTDEPFSNRPVRVLRTVDKEGMHTLTVTVTDTYYNTVSDSVQFRFAE